MDSEVHTGLGYASATEAGNPGDGPDLASSRLGGAPVLREPLVHLHKRRSTEELEGSRGKKREGETEKH